MLIARNRFIEHFKNGIDQCHWKWPRRRKSVPAWLSASFYDWIRRCGGDIDATPQQFAEIIDPLLEDLHQATPASQGLDQKAVTGMIYDRLEAAGIEVRIRPPLRAHSGRNGPG